MQFEILTFELFKALYLSGLSVGPGLKLLLSSEVICGNLGSVIICNFYQRIVMSDAHINF